MAGRNSEAPGRRRAKRWAAAFLLATLLSALAVWQGLQLRQQFRRDAWLRLELAQRVQPARTSARCSPERAQGEPPLRLLILGQSNAGNHGPRPAGAEAAPPLQMQAGEQCILAHDPLPGASGDGGSIWSRLPARLKETPAGSGVQRSPQIALLALQSTTLDDWSRPSSPLNQALQQELRSLRAAAWTPDLVLWQQGEADALSGTSAGDYIRGWTRLLAQLQAEGVQAPVLLARSTHCQRDAAQGDTNQRFVAQAGTIREAIQRLTQQHSQLRLGPDTDTLVASTQRRDGCHFSGQGLDAAALLWSEAIAATLQPARP